MLTSCGHQIRLCSTENLYLILLSLTYLQFFLFDCNSHTNRLQALHCFCFFAISSFTGPTMRCNFANFRNLPISHYAQSISCLYSRLEYSIFFNQTLLPLLLLLLLYCKTLLCSPAEIPGLWSYFFFFIILLVKDRICYRRWSWLLLPDLTGWECLKFSSSLGSCPQPAYNIILPKEKNVTLLLTLPLPSTPTMLLPAHKTKHPTLYGTNSFFFLLHLAYSPFFAALNFFSPINFFFFSTTQ